jgi:predicted nucleic acid-binding protein
MVSFIGAVIDADVLIKASVRDTLIRAYVAEQFRLHWTEHILREVERNLVSDGMASPDGARRLGSKLRAVLTDAEVLGYEPLIDQMTNDPKDRHVLAAAVVSGAQHIVTFNLRDYPRQSLQMHAIEAVNPDDFLVLLFRRDPELMVNLVAAQAAVLRKPPLSVQRVLNNLARDGVPTFAELVRSRLS